MFPGRRAGDLGMQQNSVGLLWGRLPQTTTSLIRQLLDDFDHCLREGNTKKSVALGDRRSPVTSPSPKLVGQVPSQS